VSPLPFQVPTVELAPQGLELEAVFLDASRSFARGPSFSLEAAKSKKRRT
jgi:hypothetical protein